MILSVTGHRPNKLGGYSDEANTKLILLASKVLDQYEPASVLTGMALGWDQAVAMACIHAGVPFTACIPFAGQEGQWPMVSQEKYRKILGQATKAVYVSGPGYSPVKMQLRNEYLVDHCELLVALWDGSDGGTANCVTYAEKVGRSWVNWWQRYKES